MQRTPSGSIGALALALTLLVAACGGEDDPPGGAGAGGSGGDVGAGGSGGIGGTGGGDPLEGCERPRVDSLEPGRSAPGTDIFLVGSCFHPEASKNRVTFSAESSAGAAGGVLEVTADGRRLKVRVPMSAITGPLKVSTDWGQGFVTVDGPVFDVSDDALVPKINSVSPQVITAGEGDTVVTISGEGFNPRSELLIDGEPAGEFTVASAVSIQTTLSAARLASIGNVRFQVVTSPPGGGTSNEIQLQIVAPINVVSAIASGNSRVTVYFDQPVDRNTIGGRNNRWQITREGGGGLSVRDVDPVPGNSRAVSLLTTTQSPSGRYTVIAQDTITSTAGGKIRERSASFRGFGAPPLEIETIGAAAGDVCGANAIHGPTGMTLVGDTFYVVETGGHQVQVLGADGTFEGFYGHDGTSSGFHAGDAVAAGCPGEGSDLDGALAGPRGEVVVQGARLWVADTGNDRVLVFEDGKPTFAFAPGVTWESPVILGVAHERIWIANGADGKVYRLQPSGLMSDPLLFGPGDNNGQFDFALDAGGVPAMAVDERNKEVYMTDPGNHRIQKFANYSVERGWVGKGSGEFRTISLACAETPEGCASEEPGAFTNPRDIAMDPFGTLWVIDEAQGGRVQRFSSAGYIANATYVLGYMPAAITFDAEGYMWILEEGTGVLHKYEL